MQTIIASYKPLIDTYLQKYIDSCGDSDTQVNPWLTDAYRRLSTFVTSGKSIRGALLLWSIDRYGGEVNDSVIAIAASLELIHSGFLIHDDIMDNDRQRRGQATLFSQYEDVGVKKLVAHSTNFGKNLALCVGDLALFLGMDCFLSSNSQSSVLQTIIREFTSVCTAQMQDVSFGMNKEIPTVDEVLSMYTYKTARYTITVPLCAGARLAKTSQSEIELLDSIGEDIGLVFQLSDDMLNLFGDTSKSGKSVGSDLVEEKKTFAYVTLMNSLTIAESELLQKTENSDARFTLLQDFFKSYDIRSIIIQKINELSMNVNANIQKLTLSDSSKRELTEFSTLLLQRSR